MTLLESTARTSAPPIVLLCGNPNAGKTTLFNALSGLRAKVANYPGVTIDRRSTAMVLPSGRSIELVDLPGTYSLTARSPEERIASSAIWNRSADAPALVATVIDATTLARGLYLAIQIAESGQPGLIILNMMDEARAQGLSLDIAKFEAALGVPVVPVVGRTGEGLDALRSALDSAIASPRYPTARVVLDEQARADVTELATLISKQTTTGLEQAAAEATWSLLSLGDDELEAYRDVRELTAKIRTRAERQGRNLDAEIIGARYATIDAIVATTVRTPARPSRITERLDAILTHPIAGFAVFIAVMLIVFEALFAWSEPAIALIEDGVAWLQTTTLEAMAPGVFRDLLAQGVIAGVGNVIVFVPQIALLFLLIGILEDSGYLARVAFVIDRIMASVGLHGRAFVPLLSGFACAIPAVMATRTIENRRDRLVTMLALPLMSCSARLPIYVIIIATVFAGGGRVFGVFSAGSLALLGMYLLSVVATLGAAALFRRTVLKGPRPALVLELPPYRMPLLRNLFQSTWERVRSFLRDAGTVILALTIVLWALLNFPKSEETAARYADARAVAERTLTGDELDARISELANSEAAEQLEASAAGTIGRAFEPAIEPLGFDWRLGIGILGAFAAREVFVSTLGIVFGVGEEATEESTPLRTALAEATRPDGSPLLTPLVGLSLMVFFVLACQCMSTIAVVRRESGSWRWPLFMFGYMSALAYIASLLVYQGGLALGFGS